MIIRLREHLQEMVKSQNSDAANAIRHLISEAGREVDGKESKITEELTISVARKLVRSAKYVMLLEEDLVSQSAIVQAGKQVNELIDSKIKEHNDKLHSTYIDVLSEYIPKDPNESEIIDWINANIDFTKYKNKMQAMKEVKDHYPSTDGKLLSSILKGL